VQQGGLAAALKGRVRLANSPAAEIEIDAVTRQRAVGKALGDAAGLAGNHSRPAAMPSVAGPTARRSSMAVTPLPTPLL